MNEARFHRMQLLVGDSAMARLQNSTVAIFGVGGVGSYAVEALVRAGVGRLVLVDFDTICATNINRQIHALEETVGQIKVEAMAQRCLAINPQLKIVVHNKVYAADTSAELLDIEYDYVLDCIDSISDKLHLIQGCLRRKLPIISAMGAANKLDPTLIKVADISMTKKCRLARTIRKELRKQGIEQGVKVVYSTEEFRPLTGADAAERKPTLGSSSYLPPLFGLTMAGEVIRSLIGERN
ncbi:tRNA A37 threonylcarbamoyladenosine dehydratase [Desulfuromusa kysingii]|uniref:tRNA A37 threonylcarbamoyladenosine dehydratase n=1 Tax=Desulfuromusa kysingii TaxID=37625 RepID=A0A1H3VKJ2_9BACT|nr:tRNA threonylcarbamoyladenosine dehydratase [Desulfuromusa kysingii]SDZ74774.1 tRNA A37 threonylcarbamoyladenosine dehydratase [Desulfuromusa kysingii]